MRPKTSAFFGKVKITQVDLRGNGTHNDFHYDLIEVLMRCALKSVLES